MQKPKWVYVTRVKGWIREHDPATESGLVPMKDDDADA
jgi:hypothetical protein